MAAAQQLGYHANPQAQALRRGRTTTYGFVVRNFANPFFLEVLGGAQQVAADSGATLLVLDSRYSLERERRHVQEMAVQRVAGLAIAPVGTGESIRLWQDLCPGAPVVALNGSADGITGVCRVGPDNATAVALPMQRLAELGHRSVAFLSAPRHLMADPDRLRHFRRLARELGVRRRVVYSLLTIADVQQATRALLSGPDAPTAIITNSDYTAHAVYKAARELSLPIGPGYLGRRSRRPAHLRVAGSATGDDQNGPPGHGPGPDDAAAASGSAPRLHRGRGTGRARLAGAAGIDRWPRRRMRHKEPLSPALMNI